MPRGRRTAPTAARLTGRLLTLAPLALVAHCTPVARHSRALFAGPPVDLTAVPTASPTINALGPIGGGPADFPNWNSDAGLGSPNDDEGCACSGVNTGFAKDWIKYPHYGTACTYRNSPHDEKTTAAKRWCYVDALSTCETTTPSSGNAALLWSTDPCTRLGGDTTWTVELRTACDTMSRKNFSTLASAQAGCRGMGTACGSVTGPCNGLGPFHLCKAAGTVSTNNNICLHMRPPARCVCSDSCALAKNGLCEDGGAGTLASGCALGTDCTDCGSSNRKHLAPGQNCIDHAYNDCPQLLVTRVPDVSALDHHLQVYGDLNGSYFQADESLPTATGLPTYWLPRDASDEPTFVYWCPRSRYGVPGHWVVSFMDEGEAKTVASVKGETDECSSVIQLTSSTSTRGYVWGSRKVPAPGDVQQSPIVCIEDDHVADNWYRSNYGFTYTCQGECEHARLVRAEGDFVGGVMLDGGGSFTDYNGGYGWLAARANGGLVLTIKSTVRENDQAVMTPSNDRFMINKFFLEIGGCSAAATLNIRDDAAASASWVASRIQMADAIYFDGGQTGNYLAWRGTALQSAVQAAVDAGVPIGGSSAGMMILGGHVYAETPASNMQRYEDLPLPDAYPPNSLLKHPPCIELEAAFLTIPALKHVVMLPHFKERNRMEEALLLLQTLSLRDPAAKVIGVDEATAAMISDDGDGESQTLATFQGESSVYFVSNPNTKPTACSAGQALTYDGSLVYRLSNTTHAAPAEDDGSHQTFDLTTWTGAGGVQYPLQVHAGTIIPDPYGPSPPSTPGS